MMAKFYSENKSQFIGFRQLPNFPLSSLKIQVGGIDFNDGVYESEDKVLIACLREFIGTRRLYSKIWESGSEPLTTVFEPVVEVADVGSEDEDFKEFTRMLRL